MKIFLGDFNEKAGRKDIFKPKIGNESLHEISNDNGVRVPPPTVCLGRVRESTRMGVALAT
jgi:hypothetical protein